jgi:hypothetical protein
LSRSIARTLEQVIFAFFATLKFKLKLKKNLLNVYMVNIKNKELSSTRYRLRVRMLFVFFLLYNWRVELIRLSFCGLASTIYFLKIYYFCSTLDNTFSIRPNRELFKNLTVRMERNNVFQLAKMQTSTDSNIL